MKTLKMVHIKKKKNLKKIKVHSVHFQNASVAPLSVWAADTGAEGRAANLPKLTLQ